jgi:hypothetical protein
MSYTRNFGFRDFTGIIRDGRNKVPASGLTGADASGFLLGTAVKVDPSNPGQLVRPATSAAPTALSGIVVYEHIQFQGVDPFLTTQYDPPFQVAPLGRMAQMVHGPGVKVWFRNTADKPLYDGRVQAGLSMVAGLGGATPTIAVGDYLTPAADGKWAEGNATNGWLQVESVNNETGLCEARFTF